MDVLNLLSNSMLRDLTGNRFWIDGIEKKPGIVAAKNSYITYDNIKTDMLLAVRFLTDSEEIPLQCEEYRWTPAGISAKYAGRGLGIFERKFITREDFFVSVVEIENTESRSQSFCVEIPTLLTGTKSHFRSLYNPNYIEYENVDGHSVKMQMMADITARNVLRKTADVNVVLYSEDFKVKMSNDAFFGEVQLSPGEKKKIKILGAISHIKTVEELEYDLKKFAEKNVFEYNENQVFEWFQKNVPELVCSDEILQKLYYYRWYIVYKNMINPQIGCFNDLCMYEGKDQFSLLCSASAAMHIREMRWLKQSDYVMSELKALYKSQIKVGRTKGRLRDLYISDIPTAICETMYLLPEKESRLILDKKAAVKSYVDYQRSAQYLPETSPLPIVVGSWRTAAEYQPSFFEFTTPMWDHTQSNPFGNEHKTSLHRVDDSVYLSNNLSAVATLYNLAGEKSTAMAYNKEAKRIADNVRKYMWDDKTSFYYDLNPRNLSKALQSKCYDGFLGARIEMPQKEREALMQHLENEFSAPYPILTVAKDCPAFSPDNTWKTGPSASGENPYNYDCCWNGPAWNFANSLVLDVLGKCVQMSDGRTHERLFADLFMRWCKEQCPEINAIPNSCEHYNPYTGEELRKVRDYSHSTFIDIIMRRIVGIAEADGDTICFSPLDIGLSHFEIHGIPLKGHSVDFVWNSDKKDRLQVYCDGEMIHRSEGFCEFEIDFGKEKENG